MLPQDNFDLVGIMIYGAGYMVSVAVAGAILGVPAATFFAILALGLCYLQLMAAMTALPAILQYVCFWIALPSATIAGILLAYHLIHSLR